MKKKSVNAQKVKFTFYRAVALENLLVRTVLSQSWNTSVSQKWPCPVIEYLNKNDGM